MSTDHPITPPPELVQQWWEATIPNIETSVKDQLCTQAARWGADQELEASVNWLIENHNPRWAIELRAARRPEPPSLNSIALQMLGTIERDAHYLPEITNTIRKALEALPE